MSYPTNLDSFVTHANGDIIDPDYDNEQQVAIAALEAKVGVDSSAVTTSHDYKLSSVTGSDKALKSGTSSQLVTGLTLTTPVLNVGSDATGDMYYRNAGVLTRIPIGTDNQIMKLNGATPNWEAEATTVDASTTVKGIVEAATSAEVTAGTATGGTGAVLVVTPDALATSGVGSGIFGNGIDGTVTISSNTSLSRDMYYDNLTIDSGFTLTTNGYRIFVKNTLTTTGTGKIAYNGTVGGNGGAGSTSTGGTAGTAGTALAAGSISGGTAGTAGIAGGTGGASGANNGQTVGATAATNLTNAIGAVGSATGGQGGTGGSSLGNGGGSTPSSAGTITNPLFMPHYVVPATTLHFISDSTMGYMKGSGGGGGSSSGGGGGGGTGAGGGGGGSGGNGSTGGVVLVVAKTIVSGANNSIQALGGTGGAGGAGANGAGTGGGGGGGAGGCGGTGGVVVLVYRSMTGTPITTACVAGGAGGTGGGVGTGGSPTSGATGTTGGTGVLYQVLS